MLPSLTQKISNSINDFVTENLLTFKLLKEVGVREVLESVNEKTNIMDFFKMKFLDYLKDKDMVVNRMKKDNAIILKTLIDTKPYVQDVVFDKFFAPYDLKGL